MTIAKPATKAARPFFSSGPCAKAARLVPEKLSTECLGRSHRAKIGKTRLQLAIDLMREVLQVPDTHRIGIVPGSDTEPWKWRCGPCWAHGPSPCVHGKALAKAG